MALVPLLSFLEFLDAYVHSDPAGADAVYPYMVYLCFLALEDELAQEGEGRAPSPDTLTLLTPSRAIENYRTAIDKGILKVMAKMGISTLASYKGAQVFEAVGLGKDLVKTCFEGVSSRLSGMLFPTVVLFLLGLSHYSVSGLSFPHFDKILRGWHERGYGAGALKAFPDLGQYHWRAEGEAHLHDPAYDIALIL